MGKMKALYDMVSADPALQQKIGEIVRNEEKAGEGEIKEKLVAFAKEAGFDVTIDEMAEFFAMRKEETGGELSEAELDMVAGGKLTFGGATIAVMASLTIVGCIVMSAQHSGDCEEGFNSASYSDV